MTKFSIAGLRFRNAGKIQYYHTAGMRLEPGEYVVVETMRGPEIAKVVISPDQVVVNELGDDLKPILRLATDEDIRRADRWRQKAEEILPEARRLSEEVGFPVRIDSAEFTIDGRRLTFSFTSEERLDYREFLRKASELFNARVDMRQLGARDRAKLAGGYGICGLELCCSNWLTTFPSISIRMAKEQELPLNPQKISGLCGRLLCCLSYEEDGYREMRRSLPKIGQRCSTPTGEARVIGLNILRRSITLALQDGTRVDVMDRDLGTVVRWDTTSKAGDPPPSISRADALAQGLIQPDERDLSGDLEPEPASQGRGRLPAPRRLPQPRPAPEPGAEPAPPPRGRQQGSDRNRRPGGQAPAAREQQPPAGRDGAQERGRRGRGAPPASTPDQPPRQPQSRREPTPPRERSTPTSAPGATRVFRRSGQPTPPAGDGAASPERPPRQPRVPRPQPTEPPANSALPPRRPEAPPQPGAESSSEGEAARRRRRRGTRGGKGGRAGEGDGGSAPAGE